MLNRIIYLLLIVGNIYAAENKLEEKEDWVKTAISLKDYAKTTILPQTLFSKLAQAMKDQNILTVSEKRRPLAIFKRFNCDPTTKEGKAFSLFNMRLAKREEAFYLFCKKFGFEDVATPYKVLYNITLYETKRAFAGVEKLVTAFVDQAEYKSSNEELKKAVKKLGVNFYYYYKPEKLIITYEDLACKKCQKYQKPIIENIDPVCYGKAVFLAAVWRLSDATFRNVVFRKNGGLCIIDTGDSLGNGVNLKKFIFKPQFMCLGKFAEKPFSDEIIELVKNLKFKNIKRYLLSLNLGKSLYHYNMLYNSDEKVLDAMEERFNVFKHNLEDMGKLSIAAFLFKNLTGQYKKDFIKAYSSKGVSGYRYDRKLKRKVAISGHGFNFTNSIQPGLNSAKHWEEMYQKYVVRKK